MGKEKTPDEIQKKLQKDLDAKRYTHTQGVAYTASCLAMRYGENAEKAFLAGLLHDCAKCIGKEKLLECCKKKGLPVNEAERDNPFLLHAKVGAVYAKEKYGIEDEEVLSAICWHTTGRPDMTMLEKILYVADYIEPARRHSERLPEIRTLCFEDLNRGLVEILKDSLSYLEGKDDTIDPMTKETYLFYTKQEK